MIADADPATLTDLRAAPDMVLDDYTIVALVDNALDDLHVQRLRQITNRIEQRLGAQNNRFQFWHAERARLLAANDQKAA
ncbi:hypothetical protein ACFQS7_20745 [Dankookia sp. GCM10030260]|uniref:hypothetical protein n=1 Tax=Dankookia sp. GCM10030260 TaxID=3273390 RepID=UPI003605D9B1